MAKIPENPTPGRMWGRALRRTPDQVVELAKITKADVAAANALWQTHAPAPLKKLLGPKKKAKRGSAFRYHRPADRGKEHL